MIPVKPRRGWVGPLLVFVVVVAVMIAAASGIASGATTNTLPTISPIRLPKSLVVDSGPANGAELATTFTVSAKDLGDFSAKPPAITAPAAIVVNMGTGRVLYSRNAEVRRPMASTTKIMTAILCLQTLGLETKVTVSEVAAKTPEPVVLLKKGDVLTVDQLLHWLLIRSSNAAAVALAEAVAGSTDDFVARMNSKAKELGMTDTHFANPNGLDKSGHYSTAADMAKLAQYAMTNSMFRKLVSTRSYTLSLPGRSKPIVLENTNKLLGRVSWVTGIKTGLTPQADQCLVGSGTKDGVSVISVVLGQPSTQICWDESKALMEYGFSQYRHVTLVDDRVAVAEATVPYELDGMVRLVTERPVEMDLFKTDEVTASVSIDRELAVPVQAGETFGRVLLSVKGQTVGSVDLVADKSYGKTTLGSKVTYFCGRLARWFGGIV
jgi:D-alanyl-D-alanine carboxypeptidase (penicillin-binding protein 5/6)